LIAFAVCAKTVCCQGGGFNRLYSFSDEYGTHFSNITLTGDTLAVYGAAFTDSSLPYIGITLALLDTFGSIFNKYFFHTQHDHMMADPGYDIIRLNDEGYAVVGNLFYDRTAYLTKFNHVGEVVSNKFYSLKNTYTMYPRHLIQLTDGG